MDFDFYMPVKTVSGKGVVKNNASLLVAFGSKALIITGKTGAKTCGALSDVTAALDSQNITYAVFDGIRANPLLSSCFAAGECAKKEHADFIIGIGGGSVLDAAKTAAIAASNTFEKQEDIYLKQYAHAPLPLVLVGTTAGTGSEVSKTAVITVDARMEKRSITDDRCFARLAFCDPQYTYNLSRDITVSTALDAFAHATEGWFSKKRNTTVEMFAAKCLPAIFDCLRDLAAGQTLTEAQRDTLYYASVLAGVVLCIGTTFPHMLGYTLTDKYGVPHGQACAVFDRELIMWCTKNAPQEAAPFFKLLASDYYEVITTLEALISIDEIVRLSEEEILRYSLNWTDDNPKLANVFGTFTRAEALHVFKKHFLKA